AKAITDLDNWKQKYAETDYRDTRDGLYVTAYSESKQFSKLIAFVGELMQKDLDAQFPDPKDGPGAVIGMLFRTTVGLQQLPNPTPQELAIGEKAARMLLNYNRKPEGLPDADWT